MEFPSRRGRLVAQFDQTARATAKRRIGSSGMPHVGYSSSITNDGPRPHADISGKSSPNPSLEPLR